MNTISKCIKEDYYSFLINKVYSHNPLGYEKLLSLLFDTPFIPIMDMDNNRAEDGENMRYLYSIDQYQVYPRRFINSALNELGECNMLELMIGLAERVAVHIIGDTKDLFWEMVYSLGLSRYNNNNYDEASVRYILDRFMAREYGPDGNGSLFYIKGYKGDMRKLEIWYQVFAYLDSIN